MDEISLISTPRLSTFLKATSNQDRAIELHNSTMQLGASLMAVIAQIELALRNSVNEIDKTHFENSDWIRQPHEKLIWAMQEKGAIKSADRNARRAIYAKLSQNEKQALDTAAYPNGIPISQTYDETVRARQQTFQVSEGQLIAQTTIFFWKRLFGPEYEENLWKPCLKKVFPDKAIHRPDIAENLESIYAARNRVAHHEPIYGDDLDRLFEAIIFIRTKLGKRSNMKVGPLEKFTQIQFYRLFIDYTTFKRTWGILSD